MITDTHLGNDNSVTSIHSTYTPTHRGHNVSQMHSVFSKFTHSLDKKGKQISQRFQLSVHNYNIILSACLVSWCWHLILKPLQMTCQYCRNVMRLLNIIVCLVAVRSGLLLDKTRHSREREAVFFLNISFNSFVVMLMECLLNWLIILALVCQLIILIVTFD